MPRPTNHRPTRQIPWRIAASLAILAAGAVVAAAALASASAFTLKVEKNVHVTNDPTKAFRVMAVNTHESVAVGPSGFPVYTFQGETTHHLICHKTNSAGTNCWSFWPPVSPASGKHLTVQKGIKGKVGTFRNHGTLQLTLNGQPLYYFSPDLSSHKKSQATGDELKTFGSIWHVVTAGHAPSRGASSPQSTMPTTTTNSGSTTTNSGSTTTNSGSTTTNPGPYSYGY